MNSQTLVRLVEEFLAGSRDVVVMEEGMVTFDLSATAKYSLSGEYDKCLRHPWYTVRRMVDAELRNDILRLVVQRPGQSKPTKVEICRQRDRRTATAKKAARTAYQLALKRRSRAPLCRIQGWPTESVGRLGTILWSHLRPRHDATRQTIFAVPGVNAGETQASIDAALTFGILWLDTCRQTRAGKAMG